MRRVAITGMGILSPIGNTTEEVLSVLSEGRSGIRLMDEWSSVKGLRSLVAGKVEGIEPKKISRKYRRTMGNVALMAALAANDAIADAGLNEEEIMSEFTGVSMGSTTGSGIVLEQIFANYKDRGVLEQEGTTFMKVMSHTVAANVAASPW